MPHAPINIMEANKHFGKRWKGGIRKIQHFFHPIHHFHLLKRAWTQVSRFCSKLTPSSKYSKSQLTKFGLLINQSI